MKNHILIVLVFLTACVNANNGEAGKSNFPTLKTTLSNDTLMVGDMLELKLSFSDTSYMKYRDIDGSMVSFYPPYKINGEYVENESDTYVYKETIDLPLDSTKKEVWAEIIVEVVFPNPNYGEGDVTLTKVVPYVVLNP